MKNEKTIYQKTVEHFGEDKQILKCVEEMAQLQQAIIKFQLSEPKVVCEQHLLLNLIEEIVDVEIMLEQVKCIFSSEIEKQIYEKYKSIKLEELQNIIFK